MAWATLGGVVVLPDEAQQHGGEAWGVADLSERVDALGGSDGKFNGTRVLLVAERRTRLSDGVLECWRSRTQAARAVRGLWVLVDCGALACSRLVCRETGQVV